MQKQEQEEPEESWSLDIYSSPEELEQSRRKFTDSAGWVKQTDEGEELWDGEKWVKLNK